MMICNNCEKEVFYNAAFCRECGSKLENCDGNRNTKSETIFLHSADDMRAIKLMVIHNRMKPAWGSADMLSSVKGDSYIVYNDVINSEFISLEDKKTKDKCEISIRVVDDLFVVKYRINSDEKTVSVQIGEGFSYHVPLFDAMESWDFIIYPNIFEIMPDFENICKFFSEFKWIAKNYYDNLLMYRKKGEEVFFEGYSRDDRISQNLKEYIFLTHDSLERCIGERYYSVNNLILWIKGQDGRLRERSEKITGNPFTVKANNTYEKIKMLEYLFEILNVEERPRRIPIVDVVKHREKDPNGFNIPDDDEL